MTAGGDVLHGVSGTRSAEDTAWIDLMGRAGEAPGHSPVYRMRLAGPTPDGLRAWPKDLRPANAAHGAELISGRWRFGASYVETPEGHAPWGPPFPTLHFGDRVHRFDWIRDLAALGAEGEARGRALAVSWTEEFGRWDNFGWRVGVTADRVINCLSAGPWLLASLERAAREAVLESLFRQVRHLQFSAAEDPDPGARFRCGVALSLAGAAIEEGKAILEAGLALLEVECGRQILADGGHVSRSPQALAEALIDIHTVEDLLLRQGLIAPVFLTRLQPRMASMLGFFMLPGGQVPPLHGGGDGLPIATAAIAPHGEVRSRFSFARLSGYQRVQAGDVTVYLDSSGAPPQPYSSRSHASGLSLTMDDGGECLITACGSHRELEPHLREAGRRTAAHSVLCLEGQDSAVFSRDGSGSISIDGPPGLSVRRLEEDDQCLLEGQHSAWRDRYGVIYRRRLYVARSGDRITGEESLSRPMSEASVLGTQTIPYVVRFHLHPDVMVRSDIEAGHVYLGLPRRERVWRFRSETVVSVEPSMYWGRGASETALQLVIRGAAEPGGDGSKHPNRIRWSLTRVE